VSLRLVLRRQVAMVLKTTLCRFSGLRIWPGRGMLFIRTDNQQYLFLNKKCKSLYHNRLRPAKLAWTTTYRCATQCAACRWLTAARSQAGRWQGQSNSSSSSDCWRSHTVQHSNCCSSSKEAQQKGLQ
jgi:large subunit ribosomal protein L24e